jgi:hypothetical protein
LSHVDRNDLDQSKEKSDSKKGGGIVDAILGAGFTRAAAVSGGRIP